MQQFVVPKVSARKSLPWEISLFFAENINMTEGTEIRRKKEKESRNLGSGKEATRDVNDRWRNRAWE